MSWLFSQALVEEYSAANCLDGEPSAQLNVMPTPHKFWYRDKTIDCLHLSQFGLTCAVLTADRGKALLTSYLVDFHARTSAQPEKALESTEPDPDFGRKWHALSEMYDLDTCTWKIAHSLFPEDLPESSVTLPRWGMMLNGELWELTTSVPLISATAFGLWQTPVASEANAGLRTPDGKRGPRLTDIMKNPQLWPTPRANDAEKRGNIDQNNPRNGLAAAALKYPTPTSSMCTIQDMEQARFHSSKRPPYQQCYPTPTATDWKTGYRLDTEAGIAQRNKRQKPLRDHQAPGGQLNPTWVEWLMGWPLGWTDLHPSATAKYPWPPQQHSAY